MCGGPGYSILACYGFICEHRHDVITDTLAGLWVAKLPVLGMALSMAVTWCSSLMLAQMTTMHRAAWVLLVCLPHSPEHGLLLWSNSVVLKHIFCGGDDSLLLFRPNQDSGYNLPFLASQRLWQAWKFNHWPPRLFVLFWSAFLSSKKSSNTYGLGLFCSQSGTCVCPLRVLTTSRNGHKPEWMSVI